MDGRRSGQVVRRPGWVDVRQAIERLNGGNYNDVSLYGDEGEALLSIGGESPDKLLVQFTAAAGLYWIATDESRSVRDIAVVIGGQRAEFPERHLVPLSTALIAAEAFYRHGAMAQDVRWEPV